MRNCVNWGLPVAGDNIGLALTEALHNAIENGLQREQRPAHHFVNFAILLTGSPTPTKRRISKRGCPVQQRQAQELRRQAGVTEGPSGLEELTQF